PAPKLSLSCCRKQGFPRDWYSYWSLLGKRAKTYWKRILTTSFLLARLARGARSREFWGDGSSAPPLNCQAAIACSCSTTLTCNWPLAPLGSARPSIAVKLASQCDVLSCNARCIHPLTRRCSRWLRTRHRWVWRWLARCSKLNGW